MLGPGCMTLKFCAPTVTVPVRGSAPLLASAEIPTTPGADPEAPVMMVIHGTAVVVDHAQLTGVETLKVAVPPPAGTFAAPGVSVIEQTSASCATVNVWPATVIELARASPMFGSSANDTCLDPEPDGLERMRIQEAPEATVQAHPELLFTVNDPLTPAEGYEPAEGES